MLKNRLKVARVTHGDITQQALADLVACSRQTIHSIENAKFIPSVELALRIARALRIGVEEIFTLEEADEAQRVNQSMGDVENKSKSKKERR